MKIEVTSAGTGDAGNLSGTCPHCHRSVIFRKIPADLPDLFIAPDCILGHRMCPSEECKGHIFYVALLNRIMKMYPGPVEAKRSLDPIVPVELQSEFDEASAVLSISPKASAALSRRILQRILREHAGIKKGDLANEIQELIASGALPPYLASAVDAVRNVGNFAAHPIKSTSSGQIADVEPGEAEWLLDVLEMLTQFYFVQPADAQAKIDALNKKLKDLGKPPLK